MAKQSAEHETALLRLNEKYFHSLDIRDLDATGRCFAVDAEASYLGGEWQLRSRSEIVQALSAVERFKVSTHTIASTSFEANAATATGRVFATAHLLPKEDELTLLVRGLRYDDQYEFLDGHWYIARRRQDPLWQYEVPAVPPRISPGG